MAWHTTILTRTLQLPVQQMLGRTLFLVSAVLVMATFLNIALVVHTLQVHLSTRPAEIHNL
jgi:hypothetical protein